MYVCLYLYVHTCVRVPVEAWDWLWSSSITLHLIYWGKVSHWRPELANLVSLASLLRDPLFPLPAVRVQLSWLLLSIVSLLSVCPNCEVEFTADTKLSSWESLLEEESFVRNGGGHPVSGGSPDSSQVCAAVKMCLRSSCSVIQQPAHLLTDFCVCALSWSSCLFPGAAIAGVPLLSACFSRMEWGLLKMIAALKWGCHLMKDCMLFVCCLSCGVCFCLNTEYSHSLVLSCVVWANISYLCSSGV